MTLLGLGTDLVLVLIGIGVAIGGWRRGALVSVASLAGLALGFWIGGRFLPSLLGWLSTEQMSLAEHRVLVSAVVLLGCAFILQAIGYRAAGAVRQRLGGGVRGFDSLGGAGVAVLTLGLAVWLVTGFVRATPLITANQAVADSRIVAGLDRVAPIPSTRALGSINAVLERNGFPRVFSGQPESIESADPPDSHVPAAVRQVSDSVVRVVAEAPTCNRGSEGSGWVTTGDRVVTNAHVVAGADRVAVQTRDGSAARTAELIAYDPERDVAVLHVAGLQPGALSTTKSLGAGDAAVAAGYPNNGPFTYAPARVRQTISARGLDIYNSGAVQRDVYSLRASIRPGDSGGPLFDRQGRVAGMVFARSTADSDTGYALTMKEVRPVVQASTHNKAVGSGACT